MEGNHDTPLFQGNPDGVGEIFMSYPDILQIILKSEVVEVSTNHDGC